jgi:hypothetical protein
LVTLVLKLDIWGWCAAPLLYSREEW